VVVVANQFIIREITPGHPDFLYSSNIFDVSVYVPCSIPMMHIEYWYIITVVNITIHIVAARARLL
jgi:hypothetical protein